MEETIMERPSKIVLIGGSAGSLNVLLQMLPHLNFRLSIPVIIILHRKYSNDTSLAELLADKTSLPVKEIEEKEMMERGAIYLAPPDYHLLFEKDYTFSLDFSEKVNFSRPSIDVAFESAAEVFGSSLVCILLSGANADGVEGMKAVKQSGGMIVAQNPDTAEVPFMPHQAISQTNIDAIIQPESLADFINGLDQK